MFKRFISYYKPHLNLFIFDMVAAVVVAACNLFYPYIAREIINMFTGESSVEGDLLGTIVFWSALLLGVYILKAICNYIVGYYGHVVGVRMQGDMRRDLFKKYESMPFSYYDNHKTGDMVSRLVNDLFDVSELAHHGPENLFLSVLMLIGAFAMLIPIHMPLALIMLAIIPFIVLFAVLSRRSMIAAMKASRKQMSEINSTIENSIGGIRETKAHVAENHEICKFNTDNLGFMRYRQQAMKSLGRFDAVMTLLCDILYLAVIFVGGLFLIYDPEMSGGDFAAFLLYINMFINPINRFVALFQQLQEGMSGFSRFHEIMGEREEVDTGTLEIDEIKGELHFDDVTFSYKSDDEEGSAPVLSHLDLKIRAGSTVALVGASGGGKTTICNLIPRFYSVSSGAITLDGVNITDIKLSSLRKNIGMVSQSIFLFDGAIRENIAYGTPDADDEAIIEAAKNANIHDYVMTLEKGYDTEVGERGVKLSGGQRQRIAIARVFLKNPKLLILDEATSALDNATEMQIQSALNRLSEGRTVIVVAHRLSTVKGADEIVVVGTGGIVEQGTHEALMELGGEYQRLYSYQFKAE